MYLKQIFLISHITVIDIESFFYILYSSLDSMSSDYYVLRQEFKLTIQKV